MLLACIDRIWLIISTLTRQAIFPWETEQSCHQHLVGEGGGGGQLQPQTTSLSRQPQPPDHSADRSVTSGNPAEPLNSGPLQPQGTLQQRQPAPHQLQPTLDSIIILLETISRRLASLEQEQKNQGELLQELIQSSFIIEKSGYKVHVTDAYK